jgi:hypothetical protein
MSAGRACKPRAYPAARANSAPTQPLFRLKRAPVPADNEGRDAQLPPGPAWPSSRGVDRCSGPCLVRRTRVPTPNPIRMPSTEDHAPPPDPIGHEALHAELDAAREELQRLQRLLGDAGDALLAHFGATARELAALGQALGPTPSPQAQALRAAMAELGGAVVALQFQDLAMQLVGHAEQRLGRCLKELGADGADAHAAHADGRGAAPLHPVSQARMVPGTVELF